MKIGIYCQHVLGLGHLFRTLEIANALAPHPVSLITGGKPFDMEYAPHIQAVELPGIMMDDHFNGLFSVDPAQSLDQVKSARKEMLLTLASNERFDLLLIELYPFGRRAFRFELNPFIDAVKKNNKACRIVCSIRDILVEKSDVETYESRVIEAVNRYFDDILVHSDPKLIKLDATFSRISEIDPSITYTGFITPLPDAQTVSQIRRSLQSGVDDVLIVASAGSGSVGATLLKAVAAACDFLPCPENVVVQIFTGPYMDQKDTADIISLSRRSKVKQMNVESFCSDFVSMVKAADLSVSMAGYNTCMNLVAAGTPCLVRPFDQNREQRMRAVNLSRFVPMTVIEERDLAPKTLARLMETSMTRPPGLADKDILDISGAQNTVRWIKDLLEQ